MANSVYTLAKIVSLTDFLPPFEKSAKQYTWDWEKLCDVRSTKRMQEKAFGMVALDAAQERGPLEPSYMADISELDETTITMSTYTLGTVVDDEIVLYNRHFRGLMQKLGQMCGRSHRYALEAAVAQTFNNAFDSSYPMFDGVELCGSRTIAEGSTVSNALSPTSISYDNFWLAVDYFLSTQKAQNGFYISEAPKYVLAHPSKKKILDKVLRAKGEPDTANLNNPNLLKSDFSITPIYCRFLDSTKWFIFSEGWEMPFFWVTRNKTEMDRDTLRRGTIMTTVQRWGYGPVDWVSVVGNPGV